MDISQFESIYKQYQPTLVSFAFFYLKNEQEAIDTVQELFISIWEKNEDITTLQNVKAYLYTSVKNRCMNHLTRNSNTIHIDDLLPDILISEDSELLKIESKETEIEIKKRIEMLPFKSKQIFMMSRFEQLSYKEIAEQLGISVKTVENQIGNAIKALRRQDFIFLLLQISTLQIILQSVWG